MKAAILLILVLALLVGCGEDEGTGKSRSVGRSPEIVSYRQPERIIVTSDDASLPDGCHPGQVAGLVMSFVNAFNRGDQSALSRSFFLSEGPSPLVLVHRQQHRARRQDSQRLRNLRSGRAAPLLRPEAQEGRAPAATEG